MTQEQKDDIEETLAYLQGVRDLLYGHEVKLRDFGEVVADPKDPYGICVDDAATSLADVEHELTNAIAMLTVLSAAKVEEVTK